MLQLKYLEVQGFRTYKNKVRVDFPAKGLVLIRGPSGVGKSNLLLAISYALDICPIPATKLKSWYSDRGFQVELGIETESGLAIIKRGRENSITRNGETKTGAKAVAEEIPLLTGMNTDILSAVTYRVQRKPGAFVSKGDAEKREFLGALIPLLSDIERAVEVSEGELKALKNQVEPKLSKRDGFVESLTRLQTSLVEDPFLTEWPPLKAASEEQQAQLAEKLVVNSKNRADLEYKLKDLLSKVEANEEIARRKGEIATLKAQLSKMVEDEKLKRSTFDAAQKVLMGQISNMEQGLWGMRKEILAEDQLRKTLVTLEGNQCPTCSQQWVKNEGLKKSTTEALEKIAKIKLNLPAIETAIAKMKQNLKSWEEDPQIRKLGSEISSKESDVIAELSKMRNEALLSVKDEKQKLELESQSYVNEKRRFADAVAQGDSRFKEVTLARDRFQRMVAETNKAISDIDLEVTGLNSSILMEENVIRMLGKNGFLGSIFDQILVEIETEINKMLVKMTNAQNFTIKFKTETTTGKGTTKKTITPVVYIGGYESDLATGPSGGQQSSIELVIDLAVLRVVERRTGRTPGWLLQDEVIIGQGSETSINAIEILKEFAEDKMVLVIDHSSEVKEHFQQVINVSMKDGVSYLE